MTLAQKLLRNFSKVPAALLGNWLRNYFFISDQQYIAMVSASLIWGVFIGTQNSVDDGKIPSKKVKVELSDSGMGFDFLKLKY